MTNAALSMTMAQAQKCITVMAPGGRMCYYQGYLLADRARREVALLADFMLRAGVGDVYMLSESSEPIAGLGLGYLTQKKISDFNYMYFFTKAA